MQQSKTPAKTNKMKYTTKNTHTKKYKTNNEKIDIKQKY